MTHPREAKYQKSYDQHGDSPKALQWKDYRAAAVRYKQLVADVDCNGKTVLDVGCGMGDLLPYIYANAEDFDYTGIDPTKAFIETASKRYDGHRFIVGDPFADAVLDEPYDVVFCSGVLNAKGDNWLETRKQMVKRLFELGNEAIAFNMAGGFDPAASSDASTVAYADAMEILDYCRTLTPKLTFRNHYHRRDFTIVMFK
jgi:SAM-dependent methyltransferase